MPLHADRGGGHGNGWEMPTSGGIGQARRRLGFAPRSASAHSQ